MGRPNVNLQLTSIINGKYIACRKLGEGGCGVIYEVALIAAPHRRYACKAEDQDGSREEEILRMEERVMRKINETATLHCPRFIESGKYDNYNFMVMTLLGPSISDLRKVIPTQKFTLFTTLVVGVQAVDSLKEVHNAGYVHRDVKPSNYAIGEPGTSKEKVVYILDFGLARSFRRILPDGKVVLRNPRKTVQFRGTTRYCSINAHSREEQGRQDDLWSVFYMLVEMLIGNLPWKNMTDHGPTEREKVQKEGELLQQCPREFELYISHLKQLNYASTPDYELLRNVLFQAFKKNHFTLTMKLDWEKTGEHGSIYSWNNSDLPRVISRDSTNVTLEQILMMPGELDEINEDDAMKSVDCEVYATNSSQDDTLDEINSPDKDKHKEVEVPSKPISAAMESPVSNVANTAKKPPAPKYQSGKEYKYKGKYDPSAKKKSPANEKPKTKSKESPKQKRRYEKAQEARMKAKGGYAKKESSSHDTVHKAHVKV
nr:Serine threonine protein kinase-related domain containing protein [Haemonchus contortus]